MEKILKFILDFLFWNDNDYIEINNDDFIEVD